MSSAGYRVQNPATGEIVETYDTASQADVDAALDRAHTAYQSWREMTIEERGEIVSRVANLFTERKDALAQIIAEEMGKPLPEG